MAASWDWRDSPNASRFDGMLPMDLSLYDLSLLSPSVALTANTSEIYHSGIKLDDAGGDKSHDYLLISSPRKVHATHVHCEMLRRTPRALCDRL